MRQRSLGFLFALSAVAAGAQAGVAWDEAVSGDLSDDRLLPTPLTFASGANTVLGSFGGGGPTTDRDYFSFVVPAGSRLEAVMVNPGTGISGGSSFFAMQTGSQITATPAGANVGDLLAFGHYANDAIGTNLLAALLPGGATSLSAGTYAVWVQETGGTVPFSFDFVITPVPEPAPALLLGIGLGALAWRHLRSARR